MVKSYCVKEKKQTECVPGSERYVKTENGRTMMKCTCASCGITKAKFVKSGKTGGALDVTTKPYCGLNKIPKGRHRGTYKECSDKHQVRFWGLQSFGDHLKSESARDKIKKRFNKKKGN